MMPGLWHLADAALVALFNRRTCTLSNDTPSTSEETDFCFGESLPFGSDSPPVSSKVGIPLDVLNKHAALFGSSGSGKTTTIHRLRDALVQREINCIDIDFRGDGLDRALVRLLDAGVSPDRVTLIDLRRSDLITPLNLLGFGHGDAQTRAAIMYGALKDNAESWGTLLGPDLRATLVALAESKRSILGVSSVLSPAGSILRHHLLEIVKDPYAREFLESYSALAPEAQRVRSLAVVNKLDEYVFHPVLRASMGAAGAPDFKSIMDVPGHITLVALGADRVPQASLIGRMLVSAIQRAAMARVDQPEAERVKCICFVDEAQNLLGGEAASILAEGRRFGLGLVISTQFIGSLTASLRAAVRVNCSTQVYFQTSSEEASDIAGEVVCALSRDEVRRRLISAPVGSAIVMRRGLPAAFVKMENSIDPTYDRVRLTEYRQQIEERTTVPIQEAQRAMAQTLFSSQKREEVVRNVRKPVKRSP